MKKIIVLCLIITAFFCISITFAAENDVIDITKDFEYVLVDESFEDSKLEHIKNLGDDKWQDFVSVGALAELRDENQVVWFRCVLPDAEHKYDALYFSSFLAQSFDIYMDDVLVYSRHRDNIHTNNSFVLKSEQGHYLNSQMYLKSISPLSSIGPLKKIILGHSPALNDIYYSYNLENLYIGFTLLIFSIIILLSSILNRHQPTKTGISLSITLFSVGTILVTTYPSFMTLYFNYERLLITFYDLSMFGIITSMVYYIRQSMPGMDTKLLSIIYKTNLSATYLFMGYLTYSKVTSFINIKIHVILTLNVIGFLLIVTLLILLFNLIRFKTNKIFKLQLFKLSFFIFLATVLYELSKFFLDSNFYYPGLWKFSLTFYLVALVVNLGLNYTYAKKTFPDAKNPT